ncbi:MAG: acetolactate synthase, acetolactate synthase I/II/III large subunit [Candidatus Dadabacteria bacterium CSP1-2]|nr:MAG: acetolactate synthase, acetolactate synthase I/II/III large subunit [Candidatus Dadabacteria bacterium CSP1-2]OGE23443.1 MAG: acetolactate synthase [Candidatus Dadabacteria bacterium RBG_19FT_COMBO_40_33]
MKASELLVKCLENEKVKYIFGLPGEENIDIMDALLDSEMRFILTRHEQGAAFMADVYGRLSGKAGVCLSTLGPGATNLMTGVADANMDRAPIVAITGQASLDRMHKESHQYIDIVGIFHPITKWNTQIKKPEVIPEAVRKAFKVAETEKPGATHIDFPEDVAGMDVNEKPLFVQFPFSPEPLAAQVERAAKIISEAKYPMILAGNGVIRERAADALLYFAEKLNIPVAHTFMGKGALSDNNELSLFTVGLQAGDYIASGLARADVIITIGYDIVEYSPEKWNPNRDKKIVHIDMSPAEVDAHYIISVGVTGDISISLREIADRARQNEANYSKALREQILRECEAYKNDKSFPPKPQKILSDLRDIMGEDDIVISDVGAHKLWVARVYPCYKPNTCIISNGFASMGVGVPGAIAAKLLYPERKVVTVTGDGGFLMNSQELETAVREEVPFVSLVFHDKSYSLIEIKQQITFGRKSHVNFGNPDFVKFAESFGAIGYRIEAAGELKPVLEEAFSKNKPVIVDCPVDYRENLKIVEKFGGLLIFA